MPLEPVHNLKSFVLWDHHPHPTLPLSGGGVFPIILKKHAIIAEIAGVYFI
jgi:hypothetical protein